MSFKTIMITGAIVVAIGWVVYGIYWYIAGLQEKKRPKLRSHQYENAQNSMKEYADKMSKYKKPRYNKEQ